MAVVSTCVRDFAKVYISQVIRMVLGVPWGKSLLHTVD